MVVKLISNMWTHLELTVTDGHLFEKKSLAQGSRHSCKSPGDSLDCRVYHLHLLSLFNLSAVGKNASSIISHALINLVSAAIRSKDAFSLVTIVH